MGCIHRRNTHLDSLFDALKKLCLSHGFDRRYSLAFSGGLDSTVLLHLLVNLRSLYPIRLLAVHINHSLSPNADSWENHCKKICFDFGVDFISFPIHIAASPGESLEEAARKNRYRKLREVISVNDILLTAHHQDDQAETILLQLFRGAGPKGLAAMPRFTPFYKGFHARPLLDFPRLILQKYAEENHLQWIEDESNLNIHFTRNFIRHEVIFLLKSRWPNITNSLARSAHYCAEAQFLLENFIQEDLISCGGSKSHTLSVKKLLQLNELRQRQVLRLWLQEKKFSIPSALKLQHIITDVLHAREDKLPHVMWGNYEVRRYRDNLYAMPRLSPWDASICISWDLNQSLYLPGLGTLQAVKMVGRGLPLEVQNVSVRFRQGGEQIFFHQHHHQLKKRFQEWGVPPWERDRIPFIFVNDQLVGVVGYYMADQYLVNEIGQWIELVP